MEFLKKYKHTLIIPIYGILYMLAFRYVEQRNVPINIIHMKIDDYIPFCEYFIVPYLLWFAYVAVTVFYFAFFKKQTGILAVHFNTGNWNDFIYFCFPSYPNGQNLRSELTGDSIFIHLVQYLYTIDTPTNILPSIHVFNSIACCIAIFQHKPFQKRKALLTGTAILTTLIVMATVFLKQHTLVDVIAAVALNIVCFQLLYKPKAVHAEKPARV